MKRFSRESGFDNPRVLRNFAACRKISTDGGVSFIADEYRFWLPVLVSAIRVREDVGQELKHQCILEVLRDATLTLTDWEAFLQRCEEVYERLAGRPKHKFVVVYSITYSGEPFFSRIVDGDVRIQWEPKPNSRFIRNVREARKGLARERQKLKVADEPAYRTSLLVYVSAYDVNDAHTVATDAIDCLRGMLNLFVNSNRGINRFPRMSPPHAINRFRLGPYRTVHNPDGTLATETFWYEHRWLHEMPLMTGDVSAAENFRKNLQTWWAKLQRSPLKNHIKQGLLRYCRALDLHEAEPSLTEMWSALESLTGTQREKGDLTVDRTVQLFIDRDDARQVANHIRVRHNSTVHAARTLNQHETDAILFHAESLVNRVLFFCLEEGKRFTDPYELYNILDVKWDTAKLPRLVALSKFFAEYQARKPGQ
jgi:hypothetical protein